MAMSVSMAAAQDTPTGAQAFRAGDLAVASELWRNEAARGSAEAKFGLGLMADLGLGTARDSAKALRWYLEAAEDGHLDAQFNVAVTFDAGTGGQRDMAAAGIWYARAAANGHRRAQYNLGLLYEAGEGVPHNPDLARQWFARAAITVAAAANRLADLRPAPDGSRDFSPPIALAGDIIPNSGENRIDLVWSAGPGPTDATFLVEVAYLPAPGGAASGLKVMRQRTDASAISLPAPRGAVPTAWRISRVSDGAARYAASHWMMFDEPGGKDPSDPSALDPSAMGPSAMGTSGMGLSGGVTFVIAPDDEQADALAHDLGVSFESAGLRVHIRKTVLPGDRIIGGPPQSGVHYGYLGDADLARRIATFLPVLAADDAKLAPAPDSAPGEVIVRLVGGVTLQKF